MNPLLLLRNIRQSIKFCPSWQDRLCRMAWLYQHNPLVRFFKRSSSQQITFRYPAPVKDIQVLVRDNRGSDAFVFSEVFDHRYYDFPLPFQPATILDLGANTGLTTLFFSRKYSTADIACVEPMPGNLQALLENLRLNNVRAVTFPAAVALEDGRLLMEEAEHDCRHKVAGISYGKGLGGRPIEVEAVSIPTILEKLRWQRIGLLKVDIEGYEGVLLKERCDWLTKVDAICIECHEGYDEADLQQLAEKYGFDRPSQLPGIWLLVRRTSSA